LGAINPSLGAIATGVSGLTSGSGMPNQAMMSGGRRIGGAMMDSGRVRRR